MSARDACWGIYREAAHSPGRIDDDAAIMKRVGEALRARDFAVELLAVDGIDNALARPCGNIFAMCEGSEVLCRLESAAQQGAVIVNSPQAIGNTYRHRMIELFQRRQVSAPPSRIVATDASAPHPLTSVWIKRYDFHATQPDDVIYAASEAGWHEALRRFARRGIPFVIVQQHVEGDLVKFYGVSGHRGEGRKASWFEWFYHRHQGKLGYRFEPAQLEDAALHAASVLGVEIFGGDAIIRPDGEPLIIDLNAWPSYAPFRNQAAEAIADHLARRFRQRLRIITAAE
jgi:hypothetical protein